MVAPNAFKGNMEAQKVACAMIEGIKEVSKKIEIVDLPLSDGGDGALEIYKQIFDGVLCCDKVSGPLGEILNTTWCKLNDGKTMFIESALVFGLALLPENKQNPCVTTSRGIGELIKIGLSRGIRDFVVSIGGSANNDAGKGMLSALGVRFLDKDGNELASGGLSLKDLVEIDVSGLDNRLKEAKISVLCDSSVPLTGQKGVSLMYSTGKGATKEQAIKLDKALRNYARIVNEKFGVDLNNKPSAGSGGGVVSAFEVFLKARIEYGIDFFLDKLNAIEKLKDVSLVLTAEGKVDEQTIQNKAPIGIAKLAKSLNIPTVAICAVLGENYQKVYDYGIIDVQSIFERQSKQPVTNHDISKKTEEIVRNFINKTRM